MLPPFAPPLQPAQIVITHLVPREPTGMVMHIPTGWVYHWGEKSPPPPAYRYVSRSAGMVIGIWTLADNDTLVFTAEGLRLLILPPPITRYVTGLIARIALPFLLFATPRPLAWNDRQYSFHTSGWSFKALTQCPILGNDGLALSPASLVVDDFLPPYPEEAQWQNQEWQLYNQHSPQRTLS